MKVTVVPNLVTRSAAPAECSLIWAFSSLLLAGCWGGQGIDPQLAAEQRERSKQTIETADFPLHRNEAGSGAEPPEDAEDSDTEDTAPAPQDPQPAEPAAEPEEGAIPHLGDDSVRCGNGVLDADEICEVAIAEGEDGACPTECVGLDACHPLKLHAQGCWSACVRDVPDPELCSE